MSRLLRASGEPFATGEAPWTAQFALAGDRLTRLFVEMEVEGLSATAVVDTGGAYLILNPVVAARLRLGRDAMVHKDRLVIRGVAFGGTVYRVPITLPATAGESLTFEATAFVPERSPLEARAATPPLRTSMTRRCATARATSARSTSTAPSSKATPSGSITRERPSAHGDGAAFPAGRGRCTSARSSCSAFSSTGLVR